MTKHIIILLLTIMLGVFPTTTFAGVTQQGKEFVATPKQKQQAIKTDYTYKDSKGVSYPIYLSPKGKAFIIRVSKKTGKEYKQYLPEVTKRLNGKQGTK